MPLKLLSSMAAREVLAELAAQYDARTGQPVKCEPDGGKNVAKRVRAGEVVDVVVLASDVIDELLAEGHLIGPRADLTRSGIGVAVRAGVPRPDISTEEGVKQAVLDASSLSYSTGPSGDYIREVLLGQRWGILEQIKDRIVVPPPGVPVATLVADGRAALGFQQLSELLNQDGIQLLGNLPAEIQSITTFSGAVAATSARPEASRKLLTFMAGPDTVPVKQRHGMDGA